MLQAFDAGSPMFNMYFPKNTMYCQSLHPKDEMIILNQLSLIDFFSGVKSLAITSSWLVVSFVSVLTFIWDDPHWLKFF